MKIYYKQSYFKVSFEKHPNDGTRPEEDGTGWYLVVLGQYRAELVYTWWYWNSIGRYWLICKGEVSTIRLGMLESSGFRKYSTLLVIQLFSRRLCLCHCLCIRLCLCICVPNSFLNSYYHKLSENVWVWGCGATRSEIWMGVTIAGRQPNKQGKIGLLS